MVFKNINFGDVGTNQELARTCSEHPECKDCPLLNENRKIGNIMVRCENAFAKRGNSNG